MFSFIKPVDSGFEPSWVAAPVDAGGAPSAAQAQAPLRHAGLLSSRALSGPGNVPSRAVSQRELHPQQPEVPMAGQFASALAASHVALGQVEVLFERVGQGEPLPLSVAEETVNDLLASLDEHADALISLVRLKARGDYACMHSVAVCALMACLAREMGFDPARRHEAALAGLLHDIGKAFIPARILAKPGRLTSEEFAVVRTHPGLGFDTLAATPGLADAVKDVAHHHHERPDGFGYPHRLDGSRIPLLTRMGAVCDVYDAITSNRPYKDGWDPAQAMQSMTQWAQDGQFDVPTMTAFTRLMGVYPIGSLVRLRSERLAVVNARLCGRTLGLTVTAFYCLRSQQALPPEVVEVGPYSFADAIVDSESNAQWRFRDLDRLWAGDMAQRMRTARRAGPGAVPHAGPRPA